MTIRQNFYLSSNNKKIIEKSTKSQETQLKIEKAINLTNEKCGADLCNQEISLIETISAKIINLYNRAIIISIGGSMSASKAFTACKNYQSKYFKLIYSDSLSIKKQKEIFTQNNLQNAAIIIISRSGNSVEVLHQTNTIINRYQEYFGNNYLLGKHFFIITKGDNPLRNIGIQIDANIIEYTSNGGKFSSLSIVGLLPARLIGMSPYKIIMGAKTVLNAPYNAIQAAWINYHLLSQGYNINIMSYYDDLLEQIFVRYMQISSEIVAKEGKGFSSIITNGIFDQHGLWQLFLSGPQDKYFTFLCNESKVDNNEVNMMIEKTYHKLNTNRLKEKGIPYRELIIEEISDYSLGALSIQLLLEMMILANLLDISSLTQPDIDQSKRILGQAYFSYLKQSF